MRSTLTAFSPTLHRAFGEPNPINLSVIPKYYPALPWLLSEFWTFKFEMVILICYNLRGKFRHWVRFRTFKGTRSPYLACP